MSFNITYAQIRAHDGDIRLELRAHRQDARVDVS
jgi:hypothetical protein